MASSPRTSGFLEPRPKLFTKRTLLLSAAALCVLGAWFGIAAHLAEPTNAALVDETSSAEVSHQVDEVVEKAFTYDYRTPSQTDTFAKQRLEGPALSQYEQLSGQIRRVAPEQSIVLTTKVQSSGVMSLQDDHARLLVFADQNAERIGTGQHKTEPAQLEIAAQRHGATWQVTGITVL